MIEKTTSKAFRLLQMGKDLAQELELDTVERLIDVQMRILNEDSILAVFVGPASSGKTSTINSILGDCALYGSHRKPILREGVAPTTSYIFEVSATGTRYNAKTEYTDYTYGECTGKKEVFNLMGTLDSTILRAIVDFPAAKGLPENITLVDTPGFGAYQSEITNSLVEEALGIADLVFLFVRASRGVSEPLKSLLKRLKQTWKPFDDSREAIAVLTDTERLPGRVSELKDYFQSIPWMSITEWISIPRYGKTDRLQRILRELPTSDSFKIKRHEQSKALLQGLFIPIIQSDIDKRRELADNQELNRRHIQEAIEDLSENRKKIIDLFDRFYQQAHEQTLSLVDHHTSEFENSVNDLMKSIDFHARLTPKDYSRELEDVAHEILETSFFDNLEEVSIKQMESFLEEADKYFEKIEAACTDIPDLDFEHSDDLRFNTRVFQIGLGRLLGYAGKLGGRGGVALGVMNIGRKYVSKIYRLFGRRAPANLIRRGIPRAFRPFSKLLKFAGKAWIPIQIALELAPDVYKAVKIKGKIEKESKKILTRWKEGAEKKKQSWPGAIIAASSFVEEHWMDRKTGLRAQIDNLNKLVEERLTELGKEEHRISDYQRIAEKQQENLDKLMSNLDEWE